VMSISPFPSPFPPEPDYPPTNSEPPYERGGIGCTPNPLCQLSLATVVSHPFVQASGSCFLHPIPPARINWFHREPETKSRHTPSRGRGHQPPSNSTLLGRPCWGFHDLPWLTLIPAPMAVSVRIRRYCDLLECLYNG